MKLPELRPHKQDPNKEFHPPRLSNFTHLPPSCLYRQQTLNKNYISSLILNDCLFNSWSSYMFVNLTTGYLK